MMLMKRIAPAGAALMLAAAAIHAAAEAETPFFSGADLFTGRDLAQEADLSEAVCETLADGQDIHISEAGIYVLTGMAENVTVYVETEKDSKVQIVLDSVTVTNTDSPVIYGKTADKIFITTRADSSLSVTGAFVPDGDEKADGIIYSKEDLVLNGTAALTLSSPKHGIVSKDDLKITGGNYQITAASRALDANDSIRIAGGTLNLTAGGDGLRAENEKNDAKGYIYIGGGILIIQAGDEGIQASSVVQIDDGTLTIQAKEGIRGSSVQLNGGTVTVNGQLISPRTSDGGREGGNP